jgi:hypothetical protein
MNPRHVVRGLAALVFIAGPVFGQVVDSNIGVSSFAQSRGNPCSAGRGSTGCGGCYPGAIDTSDPTSLLATVNPEWQPVGPMISGGDPTLPPDSQPVLFTGTVALSKINIGGDFPASHLTTDQNTFITVDADKVGLLATGNDPAGCTGEGCNQIEMEREVVKYPLFAWADEGDRIAALGRWIFDCGHPDQAPPGKCSNNASKSCAVDTDCGGGTCTNPAPNFNYRAELHPPQAIAVMRNKSKGKTPATQADVYISADGGGASDRCTVTHLGSFLQVLTDKTCFLNRCSVTTTQSCMADTDCPKKETCVRLDPTQSVLDINASDFEFDMPLPAKPAGATDVKITVKKQKVPKGSVMPKPIFDTTHIADPIPTVHVTVPMSAQIKGKMPNIFAQSIFATWKKDKTKLTQVQITFTGLTINNPLKPKTPIVAEQCTNAVGGGLSGTPCTSDSDCPGARCVGGTPVGWEMFAEVNGDWVKLTGLDGLDGGTPAMTAIKEKFKFKEYVPSDGAVHIFTLGHSLNCIDSLYGHNLIDGLNTFGLTAGANCLLGSDADPGRIDVRHTGAGFTTTTGSPVTCTTSGKVTTCIASAANSDGGTCSGSGSACIASADCNTGETCNAGSAYTLQYTLKAS